MVQFLIYLICTFWIIAYQITITSIIKIIQVATFLLKTIVIIIIKECPPPLKLLIYNYKINLSHNIIFLILIMWAIIIINIIFHLINAKKIIEFQKLKYYFLLSLKKTISIQITKTQLSHQQKLLITIKQTTT